MTTHSSTFMWWYVAHFCLRTAPSLLIIMRKWPHTVRCSFSLLPYIFMRKWLHTHSLSLSIHPLKGGLLLIFAYAPEHTEIHKVRFRETNARVTYAPEVSKTHSSSSIQHCWKKKNQLIKNRGSFRACTFFVKKINKELQAGLSLKTGYLTFFTCCFML